MANVIDKITKNIILKQNNYAVLLSFPVTSLLGKRQQPFLNMAIYFSTFLGLCIWFIIKHDNLFNLSFNEQLSKKPFSVCIFVHILQLFLGAKTPLQIASEIKQLSKLPKCFNKGR